MEDGFYHGIGKLKKPATKVMAPPGGATHINVFAEPEPEPVKPINKCQEERSRSSVFAAPDNDTAEQKKIEAPQNVTEDKQRASTRVLNPPGGRTSVSIGGQGNTTSKQVSHQPKSPFATSDDSAPAATPVVTQKQAPRTQSTGNPLIGGDGIALGPSRAKQPPGGASHGIF